MSRTPSLSRSRIPVPVEWPRQAGGVDTVLREMETELRRLRKVRRKRATAAAAALALVLVCGWVIPLLRSTSSVSTTAAHRSSVTLADGSAVDLNARTNLSTDFRYGRRTVRLEQGEAFFAVAKDPAHPFLVQTPAGTVRVTGTHFNVRLTDAHHVEVTLLEGAVTFERPETGDLKPENDPTNGGQSSTSSEPQVSSFSSQVSLLPGQQFVSDAPDLRALSATALENVVAWRTGMIVLDDLTVGEAAARFAAYHGCEIAVPAELAGQRLGGRCPLDDLKGFFSALEQTLAVGVMSNHEGAYRIVARPGR